MYHATSAQTRDGAILIVYNNMQIITLKIVSIYNISRDYKINSNNVIISKVVHKVTVQTRSVLSAL